MACAVAWVIPSADVVTVAARLAVAHLYLLTDTGLLGSESAAKVDESLYEIQLGPSDGIGVDRVDRARQGIQGRLKILAYVSKVRAFILTHIDLLTDTEGRLRRPGSRPAGERGTLRGGLGAVAPVATTHVLAVEAVSTVAEGGMRVAGQDLARRSFVLHTTNIGSPCPKVNTTVLFLSRRAKKNAACVSLSNPCRSSILDRE